MLIEYMSISTFTHINQNVLEINWVWVFIQNKSSFLIAHITNYHLFANKFGFQRHSVKSFCIGQYVNVWKLSLRLRKQINSCLTYLRSLLFPFDTDWTLNNHNSITSIITRTYLQFKYLIYNLWLYLLICLYLYLLYYICIFKVLCLSFLPWTQIIRT